MATADELLAKLEERFILGEITEETYRDLLARIRSRTGPPTGDEGAPSPGGATVRDSVIKGNVSTTSVGSVNIHVGAPHKPGNDEIQYERFVLMLLKSGGTIEKARVELEKQRLELNLSLRLSREIEAACLKSRADDPAHPPSQRAAPAPPSAPSHGHTAHPPSRHAAPAPASAPSQDGFFSRMVESGVRRRSTPGVASSPSQGGISASEIFDELFGGGFPGVGPRYPDVQAVFTNSIGMRFVSIAAGEFAMGSPDTEIGREEYETQTREIIARRFLLSCTQVTQAQWTAVMGKNPGHFKGDNLPVESVTWDDALEFCRRLGQKEEKKYRLPTAAEWEYACRAGTTTRFHGGNSVSALDEAGWYKANSGGRTHAVAQKKPNAWGLYDMHGNVSEWCSDICDNLRANRGGAWNDDPKVCRCACAGYFPSELGGESCFGFPLCAGSSVTPGLRHGNLIGPNDIAVETIT